LLNSNMSSTFLHNMANFGPLTAEIGSGVWGTPANFNGFRVLPSLIHFQGLLPLYSPMLAVLLHGTSAAGVSQTLRHHTKNGITQLSQRTPPIFGRAAITLGISSHSSCLIPATSHRASTSTRGHFTFSAMCICSV